MWCGCEGHELVVWGVDCCDTPPRAVANVPENADGLLVGGWEIWLAIMTSDLTVGLRQLR